MPFSFSHRKAPQAAQFFARRAGGTIEKLMALKLVYFADRYTCVATGGQSLATSYLAMQYAQCPSNTKDLAENERFSRCRGAGLRQSLYPPQPPRFRFNR